MSDPTALPPSDGDAELLSAYLAGDLDEDAGAALEARLRHDPALARRLDATAEVMAALRGVDEVAPPAGAGDRLRARLTAETSKPEPGPRGRAQPPVTSLRTRRRRVSWPALGGVAAGLAALALMAGGVLQGSLQLADQTAGAPETAYDADERLEGGLAEDSSTVESQPQALEGPGGGEEAGEHEQRGDAGSDGRALPVLADTEVRLEGRTAAHDRYSRLPEVAALWGEPVPVATERAAAYQAAVADAPAFRSGTRPGACLDQVGADGDPLVPVRVESVVYKGRPALVYVLVTAAQRSPTLDRAQAWVVTPPACTHRLTLDLS